MTTKVNVFGTIISSNDQDIYDWLGYEATSPKKVAQQMQKANGGPIDVYIQSGGGSVFDGSAIYVMLKEYKNKVTVKITGLAASAASVIAMAGDKVLMAPTSQLMIHNVSTYVGGDYRQMDHTSEILKKANSTLANAYMIKSGLSLQQVLDMMDKETWFTPAEALSFKLIDGIMFVGNEEEKEESEIQKELNRLKKKHTNSDTKERLVAEFNLLKLKVAKS